MWTRFFDMSSGGGEKTEWSIIYVEADSEDQAVDIFSERFGDPYNITCDCCGSDFSVGSQDSLEEITEFDRDGVSVENFFVNNRVLAIHK